MEPDLWKLFENINRWLEYAERKNTYILTFAGAEVALIKLFDLHLDNWQTTAALTVLSVSLLTVVYSFLPKTKISDALYFLPDSHGKPEDTDNLLFFKHIAKYSVSAYIAALEKRYFKTPIKGQRYLEDLCNQIVVNSGIATAKFRVFNVAATFVFIAQPLLIWAVLRVMKWT